MGRRTFRLEWPSGGLVKRKAFQRQSPYSTPKALNVWTMETFDLRDRGGRRAGLSRLTDGLAGNGPYRALAPVPKAEASDYEYMLMCCVDDTWYYPVSGGSMTEWSTGGLASTSGRVAWAVRYSILYYLDGTTLKVMDPYAPSLASVVASAGSLPTGCNLCRLYRDRLVMATRGGVDWYMSRSGDPTDWDYAPVNMEADLTRAVEGASSDQGVLQEPLNAIVPSGVQYCLFGLDDSLWRMTGDPAYGGEIHALSRQVGIIGDDAWAFGPNQTLVFLDWSGVYVLQAGSSQVEEFSRERLPADLRNIDPNTYEVVLEYDDEHNGFLLAVTPRQFGTDGGTPDHWWIDWARKAFWRLDFPDSKGPRFFSRHAFTSGTDHVLALGCEDGGLRHLDNDADDDDGTAITAYCDIGPFRLSGDDYRDGLLVELVGTLAEDGDEATWSFFGASSAEGAVDAATGTADRTGIWSAGRNRSVHPRARAGAGLLELSGSGRWAFESALCVVQPGGKQRI